MAVMSSRKMATQSKSSCTYRYMYMYICWPLLSNLKLFFFTQIAGYVTGVDDHKVG